MVYVMSDIHGAYEEYMKMLETIHFSRSDVLYVLGDVIDRGPEPVKLLREMSMQSNVYPIIGNHELMALDILEELMVEITQDNYATHLTQQTLLKLLDWQQNGGAITLQQFQETSREERLELMEYMREFSLYEVAEAGDKVFILVHSGLGHYAPGKKLWQYTAEELTFQRPDYERQYIPEKSIFIVSGHTPTLAISGKAEIYYSHQNIAIDCGAAYGGRLACLCLDTMEEYYV